MADTFELEVATPERLVIREAVTRRRSRPRTATSACCPATRRCCRSWARAMPAMCRTGTRRSWRVHGGFVEVLPDKVRVLAETVEKAEEIDVQRAEAALKRAQEQLSQLRTWR